jgi:glycine cleavage system regulatory protein
MLVTGIGKDRTGIARDITGLIFDEEGNITDSRITKFQQNFTLMFLVEILEKNIESFKDSIKRAQEMLSIHLDASEVTEMPSVKTATLTSACLSVMHEDSEVQKSIQKFLNKQGITMEKVELSQVSAPMGGTDLFQLKAKVSCESFSFEEMRKKLEKFDDPLLISLELKTGN